MMKNELIISSMTIAKAWLCRSVLAFDCPQINFRSPFAIVTIFLSQGFEVSSPNMKFLTLHFTMANAQIANSYILSPRAAHIHRIGARAPGARNP
jgi:hypothetical protein